MRLLALLCIAGVALGAEPDWKRGRHVYLHGAGTAIVGGSAELPASSLPCGSCHGPDGRGVAEGTVVPADIRWSVLSQPRATGKLRGRYDDASLRRAIAHGLDPAESELSPLMPRYRMSDGELADLVAYLRRLGEAAESGLTDSRISVGTTITAQTPVGEATRAVLAAYFDDVNRAGGIFGRTLHLADSRDDVFAMLCGTEADPDERMPVIAPFPGDAPTPSSFFIYPDLTTQALALAKAVDGPREVVVVHDGSSAAVAASDALAREGWTIRAFAKGTDDDVVFLLGRVDAPAILRRLDELQWRPRVLGATPTLPRDVTAAGLRELESFATRHGLPPKQVPAQIAAYATVKVFVEGLKRAGRDLTREKLIAALERLYAFDTGLTPPVTFHRGRHVGSEGYVIALGPTTAR